MPIDFTPVANNELKMLEFSQQVSLNDLRQLTHDLYSAVRRIIESASDAQIVYEPVDPNADDPYAKEGEETLAWNLGHLVGHVTASNEEGAAFSSLLARGVSVGGRLRYETPWQEITTREQALKRLDESQRMCLAYLDTWPDEPNLTVVREISPKFVEKFGNLNATASYLFGFKHMWDHIEQFESTLKQVQEATAAINGD